MNNDAFLALADGTILPGKSGGAARDVVGETVFNTGMTGYQEIASDPSYAGQIVALTAAEIGNYGCNPEDMESRGLFLNGLVVHGLNEPSSYRSRESLSELLRRSGVPCLYGVDVRRLTLLLRRSGSIKAYLHASGEALRPEEAVRRAQEWEGLDNQDYASRVSTDQPYVWSESGERHVVVYDFGVKRSILRELARLDLRVTVTPAWTPADDVLALEPDGVVFSNGPADPSAVPGAADTARELSRRMPALGICLGHQILGLAWGVACGRLKFGHHGCNHPVRDNRTGETAITSQNHNFALRAERFPPDLEITHVNLNDGTIEGFRHRELPIIAVQFHPEAGPGPHDARGIFQAFRELL